MGALANLIEQACADRQQARSRGDAAEAAKLDKAIGDLYARRRAEQARARAGDPEDIRKRARIEAELGRQA